MQISAVASGLDVDSMSGKIFSSTLQYFEGKLYSFAASGISPSISDICHFDSLSICPKTPLPLLAIKHITTSWATFLVPFQSSSSSWTVLNFPVTSALALIVSGYYCSNLSRLFSFLNMYLTRRRLRSIISLRRFTRRCLSGYSMLDCGLTWSG